MKDTKMCIRDSVMEEDHADGVANSWECWRRQTQLCAVDECACSTDGKTSLRIARPGSIDGEAAQGSGSAGVEALREGDEFTGGVAECSFLAITSIAGEDVTALVEGIVARVGKIEPIELGLSAK